MLFVTQSQSIQQLFLHTAQWLKNNPVGVFERVQVIVPSHGVGVWLKSQMAQQQGLCTLVDTHFMGSFEWDCYIKVLGRNAVPSQSPLNSKSMQAKLYQCFAALVQGYSASNLDSNTVLNTSLDVSLTHFSPLLKPILFAVLQAVVTQCSNGVWQFKAPWQTYVWSFAGQLAQIFSQYIIYRADWLHLWGKNQQFEPSQEFFKWNKPISSTQQRQINHLQQWQSALWQQLFAQDFATREKVAQQFWQVLEKQPQKIDFLPKQVTLFTLLQLAPAELLFLRKLAQYTQIHLFYYNPSMEYWADIVDYKWKIKQDLKNSPKAQYRESGHTVLSVLGKQARNNFKQLVQLSDGENSVWWDDFIEKQPQHLLEQLKYEILNLQQTQPNSFNLMAVIPVPPLTIDLQSVQPKQYAQVTHLLQCIKPLLQDESIQIHVCHNAKRQLEVLRERLLQRFSIAQQDNNKNIQPHDVLILVPQLADWLPTIRAVFNQPMWQNGKSIVLPYAIAGEAGQANAHIWQSFEGLFTLLQQPLYLSQFLDWLALPATMQFLGLQPQDLVQAEKLLQEAGFKAGFDETHLQQQHGVHDGDTRFTLSYAMQRLQLGMVYPSSQVYNGVLPQTPVLKSDFELIGKLAVVQQQLALYRHSYETYQPVGQWCTLLFDVLQQWLPQHWQAEKQHIGQAIQQWQQKIAAVQGFSDLSVHAQNANQTMAAQNSLAGQSTDTQTAATQILQLPLKVILADLNQAVQGDQQSSKPTNRITFARMGTLRPLPYQLVAIMGLDSGAFPQKQAPNIIDITTHMPQRLGDYSAQHDDEGAFLDALLQANEACWLFYTGFKDDGKDMPPAQPVNLIKEWVDSVAHVHIVSRDMHGTETIAPVQANTSPTPASHYKASDLLTHHHSLYAFNEPLVQQNSGQVFHVVDDFWFNIYQQGNVRNTNAAPLMAVIQDTHDKDVSNEQSPFSGSWLQRYVLQTHQFLAQNIQAVIQQFQGVMSLQQLCNCLIKPDEFFFKNRRISWLRSQETPQNLPSLKLTGLEKYSLQQQLQMGLQQALQDLQLDELPDGLLSPHKTITIQNTLSSQLSFEQVSPYLPVGYAKYSALTQGQQLISTMQQAVDTLRMQLGLPSTAIQAFSLANSAPQQMALNAFWLPLQQFNPLGVKALTSQKLVPNSPQTFDAKPNDVHAGGDQHHNSSLNIQLAFIPNYEPVQVWLANESGDKRYILKYWLQHLVFCAQATGSTQTGTIDAQQQGRTLKNSIQWQGWQGYSMVVCQKQVHVFTPVNAKTAHTLLSQWMAVCLYSAVLPWLLPPQLLLHMQWVDKGQYVQDMPQKALGTWRGHSSFESNAHADAATWQLIFKDVNPNVVDDILLHTIQQFVPLLYAPLVQHLHTATLQDVAQQGLTALSNVLATHSQQATQGE